LINKTSKLFRIIVLYFLVSGWQPASFKEA
jgi:hypothetical protein